MHISFKFCHTCWELTAYVIPNFLLQYVEAGFCQFNSQGDVLADGKKELALPFFYILVCFLLKKNSAQKASILVYKIEHDYGVLYCF